MILTCRRRYIMPDIKDEHKHHGHTEGQATPTGTTDINYKAILKFAVWMGVAALFIHGTMWVLFRYYLDSPEEPRPQPPSELASKSTRIPPKPNLQLDPIKDMQDFQTKEQEAIEKGKFETQPVKDSISIEKAMEEVLQKGLPTRPPGDNQTVEDKELREDSSSGRLPEKRNRW
jgi:hypothetical protein